MIVNVAFPIQAGDIFKLGNTEVSIIGQTKIIRKDTQNQTGDRKIRPAQPNKPPKCCPII